MACLAMNGWAQTPSQPPIKILVGAPAGGTTDTMARTLATVLGTQLGRTVVVEGRALQPVEQAVGQWSVVSRARQAKARLAEAATAFDHRGGVRDSLVQTRVGQDLFRRTILTSAAVLAALGTQGLAGAQAVPSKPITLQVPFAPWPTTTALPSLPVSGATASFICCGLTASTSRSPGLSSISADSRQSTA